MSLSYPLKPSLRNLAARLAKVEVLIADPDTEVSRLVRDVLRYAGFQQITIVKDGREAIAKLKSNEVDLLITDWQMEQLNGIELIRYLRTNPDSPNPYLPIIMLTGKAERMDVESARDAGVTEFLVKPFTAKGLFERLVMVIENPRSFIISSRYMGPDRRRRTDIPPTGSDRRLYPPVGDEL